MPTTIDSSGKVGYTDSTKVRDLLASQDPTQARLMQEENVIVVDLNDNPCGSMSKFDAHLMQNIKRGVLHRAISVFIFNTKGELLVTRRASSKLTYPGVWTNSLCSHPRFNEEEMNSGNEGRGPRMAARRRLADELGLDPKELELDDIKYMWRSTYPIEACTAHKGTFGEFEMDYLLVIQKDLKLEPNPNEVDRTMWVGRKDFASALKALEAAGSKISPWFKCFFDTGDLFKIWDNLDRLDSIKDHKTIFYRHM